MTADHLLVPGFQECDRAEVVALLQEYWAYLGVPLGFQGFASELADLPGDYAPPGGGMILARARDGGALVACVAVRPVAGAPDMCEMKRLYVRETARGTGLGRTLALAALAEGRRLGYRRMCLDTLPQLTAAKTLYLSLGFRKTGIGGGDQPVVLFERDLD